MRLSVFGRRSQNRKRIRQRRRREMRMKKNRKMILRNPHGNHRRSHLKRSHAREPIKRHTSSVMNVSYQLV